MEHALECIRDKKDRVKSTKNINLVRKCKGVTSHYELLVENGKQLTNCERVVQERSSATWKRGTVETKKSYERKQECLGRFYSIVEN